MMQRLTSLAAGMAGFRTPLDMAQAGAVPASLSGLDPSILAAVSVPTGVAMPARVGQTVVPGGATGPSPGGPRRG